MKPGDIVVWHPEVLSGVPRRVEIVSIGTVFAQVAIVAGDPNPNGARSYTARVEELRARERLAA